MKLVAISGYFDPLHVGHLEYIKLSKKLGDRLVVIVNNDFQSKLKKGKSFMNESDRLEIVKSIIWVDDAIISVDKDGSVCKSIELVKPDIFANGGDRKNKEIPESKICNKLGIKIIDGIGKKNKKQLKLYWSKIKIVFV